MRDTQNAPGYRLDIQGLRAIAALTILVYHLAPGVLPGGYVGVDVFFVVSGFLITGLLLKEQNETGRIAFRPFFARRLRRLLPAAMLVLFTVLVCTPLLPEALWNETAWSVVASTAYVQNWWLAHLSVDYLGSENAPTPVQHFWSLSIEEQFYLFWPFYLAGLYVIARRWGAGSRTWLLGGIGLLTLASFGYGVFLTVEAPTAAYFLTPARLWQLSIGGLLALLVLSRGQRLLSFSITMPLVPEALRLLGLALIAFALFGFGKETAFPGLAALVPVSGTLLILVAGCGPPNQNGVLCFALSNPVARFLGDISYALYLWHWPVIVFYKSLTGDDLDALEILALATVSIALAWATKVFVEDRFRLSGRPSQDLLRRSFRASFAVLALGLLIPMVLIGWTTRPGSTLPMALQSTYYPGPAALLEGSTVPVVADFQPRISRLKQDKPSLYALDCHVARAASQPIPCPLVEKDEGPLVVLAGDSHAAQWAPALVALAIESGWRLVSHTKSSCGFSLGAKQGDPTPDYPCQTWSTALFETLLSEPPAMLVVSQSRYNQPADQSRSMADDLVSTWSPLQKAGTRIVVIADTPWHQKDLAACLRQPSSCGSAVSDLKPGEDPLPAAAKRVGAKLIDLNDMLCRPTFCPAIIGNVIVWRDRHHLTATYARRLGPELGRRLKAEGLTLASDEPLAPPRPY